MAYENKRPSRKVLTDIVNWLAQQGISLYGQHCDIEAGIRYPSNMDIKNVDEIIGIYNHNKAGDWEEDMNY